MVFFILEYHCDSLFLLFLRRKGNILSSIVSCTAYMMTILNNDGKTSLSRPPDLEGTEEICPHVWTRDWTAGVRSIFLCAGGSCQKERVSDVHFPNLQLSFPCLFC